MTNALDQYPGPELINNSSEAPALTYPDIPVYFAGGFGYTQQRNTIVGEHIQGLGSETVPPLQDPDRSERLKGATAHYHSGEQRVIPTNREAYSIKFDSFGVFGVKALTARWQEIRANQLLQHIKSEQGGRPIDAIFQSADALNGLLAAREEPTQFHNIVLAFPAGLARRGGIATYQRDMLQRRKEAGSALAIQPEDALETRLNVRSRIQQRRRSGGADAAWSTATSYHPNLLHELKQGEDSPGVSLVLGLKDATMLWDKVIGSLADPKEDVDILMITNSGHAIKSKKLLKEVLDLFPRVEEVKQQRHDGVDVGSLADRVVFTDDVSETDKARVLELIDKRQQEVNAIRSRIGTMSVRVLV